MPKGDSLGRPVSTSRQVAASAQWVGGRTTGVLVLKDRAGVILLLSDPASRTTSVALNSEILAVMDGPAPSPATARSSAPVGCDRLVSPLVKSTASEAFGRCLS